MINTAAVDRLLLIRKIPDSSGRSSAGCQTFLHISAMTDAGQLVIWFSRILNFLEFQ
jgi:hypothetical protein